MFGYSTDLGRLPEKAEIHYGVLTLCPVPAEVHKELVEYGTGMADEDEE
jgi:hypothetical protein